MVTTRRSISDHAIDDGDEENQARAFGADEFAEAEDDAALVFAQDAHGLGQDDGGDDEQDKHARAEF